MEAVRVYASGYPAEDTVCLGESVAFVNRSSAVADQFSWTFGDGGTSTDKNPVYTFISPGIFLCFHDGLQIVWTMQVI